MKNRGLLILLVAFTLISCNRMPSPDFTVGRDRRSDFRTLQEALADDRITDGAIIGIRDRIHTESSIHIDKDVTLVGLPLRRSIIQAHKDPGMAPDRVMFITEGTTVSLHRLILRHGNPLECPKSGGAIYNRGNLTLYSTVVTQNSASCGGGIDNSGSLTLIDSEVSWNIADRRGDIKGSGGGIKSEEGPVVILRSRIIGNTTLLRGGGIKLGCGSTLVMSDSIVRGNRASQNGGAIHSKGEAEIRDTLFRGNLAFDASGIVNKGSLIVDGLRFRKNISELDYGNVEILNSDTAVFRDGDEDGA